jgi:hypothetical protein
MREIRVAVPGRPYVVHIERGIAGALGPLLEPLGRARLAVVSSPTVWEAHRPRVVPGRAFLDRVWSPRRRQKTARRSSRSTTLRDARLGRDSFVLPSAGRHRRHGGPAAATYMRGVDWVGVPTTPCPWWTAPSGKVGINHPRQEHDRRLPSAARRRRPAFLATLPPPAADRGLRGAEVRDHRRPRCSMRRRRRPLSKAGTPRPSTTRSPPPAI